MLRAAKDFLPKPPMTENQTNILLATLAICAFTLTGLAVRREFAHPSDPLPKERHVDNWETFGKTGLTLGSSSAPVRVVVFSDYQCPYCARLSQSLASIRRTQNIAVTYRHYPLEVNHPFALKAALAAECANAQGRFPEMHAIMISHRDSLGIESWARFAKAAGIPAVGQFTRCIRDSTFIGNVRRDIAAGDALGIEATPTFLVRDRVFAGDPGPKRLSEILAEANK